MPDAPALSAQLSLGEEKTLTTETLLTLVRTAGGYGMLAGIGSVDLSDAEAITFTYLGRFTVRLHGIPTSTIFSAACRIW